MRYFKFASLLLSTLLLEGITSAQALEAADGCAPPPSTASHHVFYISPTGRINADGTSGDPWHSLAMITATTNPLPDAWKPPGCNGNSGCATGPLLATQPYYHYDPAQQKWATSVNPNAPIRSGDTVYLYSGNYGDVSITGVDNPAFITITAVPGQRPVLSSLKVVGSQKWIIQGLTFRSLVGDMSSYINVAGNSSNGASADVIIDSNNIAAADNVDSWSPANWSANIRGYGIVADGGDQYSTYAKCVTITNNSLSNLRSGMSVMANNTLVDSNNIDNFGDDGIDFSASNLVISHNRITNSRNIGDGNHNDAMQGQIGRGVAGTTYNNIMIDGNTVVTETQHPSPMAFPGDLQGIDAFDMDWSNVSVINNIVITNLYHGIAFYSLHGGLIANNTVLASTNKGTWIGVFDKSHQGTSSNNVIVRNNIASVLNMDSPTSTLTADHNLVAQEIIWTLNGTKQWITRPGTYTAQNVIDANGLNTTFMLANATTFAYDVHLRPGTLAIGTGNLQLAPITVFGAARTAPIDLGAYPLN